MAKNDLSRRAALAGLIATATTIALPVHALSSGQAQSVVQAAVDGINKIIRSRKSDAAMLGDFRKVFNAYADVPTIALSTLGPAGRSASNAQKRAYIEAFSGYFTSKYGRRFNEYVGGQITVNSARQTKSFYEVKSTAKLSGSAPFGVTWLVSDRSGKPKIFNIIIEGVNTLTTERVEIGAMLDKRGGNIDRLTADLKKLS